MEDTLEPNEEICTMTPECSQDAELIQEEEVTQDVVTQEPTSLGIAAENPKFQLEDDLGVDIIPNIQWSEDEQTISLGDTELLEEEWYDGEDIPVSEAGEQGRHYHTRTSVSKSSGGGC